MPLVAAPMLSFTQEHRPALRIGAGKRAWQIHRNSLKPGYKLHWYRIEDILGQGGFGLTYLVYDFNLDQKAAIKEYLPIELAVRERDFSVHPVSEDSGEKFKWGLDRFITEARTLARFKHPNIVRVLNVIEANNTAYMVMEYEQGESLQEILSARKTYGGRRIDEPAAAGAGGVAEGPRGRFHSPRHQARQHLPAS
ncbi:MAG: protein kinase [Gammaproteobacteria bacterium]|nr:protein kinase [Gammaproteobacteria bacterium]